jgi:hypothetical protein
MGIGLALLGFMVPRCWNWGLEEAEFSWVAESNDLSRGSLEKGGAERRKTYRVYDLEMLGQPKDSVGIAWPRRQVFSRVRKSRIVACPGRISVSVRPAPLVSRGKVFLSFAS